MLDHYIANISEASCPLHFMGIEKNHAKSIYFLLTSTENTFKAHKKTRAEETGNLLT